MMKHDGILRIRAHEMSRVLGKAEQFLREKPVHITDSRCPVGEGGPHDYCSNGDYWWPNPNTQDGLPYVRRDGQSNPQAFHDHRLILKHMRDVVACLGAAYKLTKEEKYAQACFRWLCEFFLDGNTRMNPHLLYAQAVPGVCTGRGIGIIDTVHIIEVPLAISAITGSPSVNSGCLEGLRKWFADYVLWLRTHPFGIEEMNQPNNHGTAWILQVAAFSRMTNDVATRAFLRDRYKTVTVPRQMNLEGGFDAELARTKPYAYSLFQLDNVAALCQLLSDRNHDLWNWELPDGRGARKAVAFLYPFIRDKQTWPWRKDIEYWEGWPVRSTSLLLAGLAYQRSDYLDLWESLPVESVVMAVRHNVPMTQPVLWFDHGT